MFPQLRVVPLFETLDDLDVSQDTMRQLLSNDWYREHIKGVQECMIGYSDSGKDAGRLAAAWALFEVQERLTRVAEEYDVHLTVRGVGEFVLFYFFSHFFGSVWLRWAVRPALFDLGLPMDDRDRTSFPLACLY